MEKAIRYYKVSVAAFIIAALIHVLGYFTNVLYLVGWLMWLPAVVLFIAAIIQIIRDGYIKNPYVKWKKVIISGSFILTVCVCTYVIFNIIYNCYILRNGGGEFKDGTYYLINLGERVKEISAGEYSRLLLAEYRLFTGHILFLYSVTILYFRMKYMEYKG